MQLKASLRSKQPPQLDKAQERQATDFIRIRQSPVTILLVHFEPIGEIQGYWFITIGSIGTIHPGTISTEEAEKGGPTGILIPQKQKKLQILFLY